MPPRPVSAGDREMVDAIVQLSFAVQEVLARFAAAHELSLTQLRLLAILRDREPGTLELARHLGLEKSSASGLIDRAERRGLVARGPSPDDGRGVRVGLTDQGRRLVERTEGEVLDALIALLAPVPAGERGRLAATAAAVVRQHAAAKGLDLSAGG